MRRLLDMGMEQLKKLIGGMGEEAITALQYAKESLEGNPNSTIEISSKLHIIRGEVLDIATELLVRYSPVAGDLRFIQSSIDVSYDLYRVSRYAMEIERSAGIVESTGLTPLLERGFSLTEEALRTAVDAFENLDEVSFGKLLELDREIDGIYIRSLEELKNPEKCSPLEALIMRHLERISDHARDIGATVIYIREGRRV